MADWLPDDKSKASDSFKEVVESSLGGWLRSDYHSIFTGKNAWADVASTKGLKFKKKRGLMLQSAIDGCIMCQELLNMPCTLTGVPPKPISGWPAES